MLRHAMRSVLVLVPVLVGLSIAHAHDLWISREGKRNAAGEWCCGEGDCFAVPGDQVRISSNGYTLFGAENVPFNEAQPSPDGIYWRCMRPDGSRRCFFAPPQSY